MEMQVTVEFNGEVNKDKENELNSLINDCKKEIDAVVTKHQNLIDELLKGDYDDMFENIYKEYIKDCEAKKRIPLTKEKAKLTYDIFMDLKK